MERSTKGVFDFLCNQMENLEGDTITYHELMAHAAAARQLHNIIRLELDVAKFKHNTGGKNIESISNERSPDI